MRTLSRHLLLVIAMFCMLSMQFALAAYTCPVVNMAETLMRDCAGMDTEQPSLCHAHTKQSTPQQLNLEPPLPALPDFVCAELVLILLPVTHASALTLNPTAGIDQQYATSPPLTTQFCRLQP